MYYAALDTEGGKVECRVAPLAGAKALCAGDDEYVEVEWLEGPKHGTRTTVPRASIRYEHTNTGWDRVDNRIAERFRD